MPSIQTQNFRNWKKTQNLLSGLKMPRPGRNIGGQTHLVRRSFIPNETNKHLPIRTRVVLSSRFGCDRVVIRWMKAKGKFHCNIWASYQEKLKQQDICDELLILISRLLWYLWEHWNGSVLPTLLLSRLFTFALIGLFRLTTISFVQQMSMRKCHIPWASMHRTVRNLTRL